jgi:hypothetical protein
MLVNKFFGDANVYAQLPKVKSKTKGCPAKKGHALASRNWWSAALKARS